jgi:hypothetical protein
LLSFFIVVLEEVEGGATTTAPGSRSYGFGGIHGNTRVCNIPNPPATISTTRGVGGTGGFTSNGTSGGFTSIVGCNNATGGNGGPVTSSGTGRFLGGAPDAILNGITNTTSSYLLNIYGTSFTATSQESISHSTQSITSPLDYAGDGSINSAVSGAGGTVISLKEIFNGQGGFRVIASSDGNNGTYCAGGSGALNLSNQGTSRTGGNGGDGMVVAFSYE